MACTTEPVCLPTFSISLKMPRNKNLTELDKHIIGTCQDTQWSNGEISKRIERSKKVMRVVVKNPGADVGEKRSSHHLYYLKQQKDA